MNPAAAMTEDEKDPLITSAWLGALIRDTCKGHPDIADAGAMVEFVIAAIPAHGYHDALAVTLRPYVREEFGRARRTIRGPTAVQFSAPKWSPQPARMSPAKRRRAQIADTMRLFVANLLGQRVHGKNGGTLVGDCIHEDLVFIVANQNKLSAANADSAKFYARLDRLLLESGKEHVRDVPPELLVTLQEKP